MRRYSTIRMAYTRPHGVCTCAHCQSVIHGHNSIEAILACNRLLYSHKDRTGLHSVLATDDIVTRHESRSLDRALLSNDDFLQLTLKFCKRAQNPEVVMRSTSFLALKCERKNTKKEVNELSPCPSSFLHIHELQVKEMGHWRITSWYPKFNGSHVG